MYTLDSCTHSFYLVYNKKRTENRAKVHQIRGRAYIHCYFGVVNAYTLTAVHILFLPCVRLKKRELK